MPEQLTGFVATGSGQTRLELVLDAAHATLHFHGQWMGDDAPSEITLELAHTATDSHSGALTIESAQRAGHAVPLPPAPDPLVLEYARVPPQRAVAAATWGTDPWSLLLWLSADAIYDDGTDLPAADYDVPPEQFAPVAKVLGELERPWKLG